MRRCSRRCWARLTGGRTDFKAIQAPILVVTSEFATVSMWDWEINRYLALEGVRVIAPYNLEQTKMLCRALALKSELRQSRLLVYQDNPGEGFQAEIFKRFYWWEEECTQRMGEKFGVQIVKQSFKELGERAKAIPDEAARRAWEDKKGRVQLGEIPERALLSAVKLYLAVKGDLAQDASIRAVGINCLNEFALLRYNPLPGLGPAVRGARAAVGLRGGHRGDADQAAGHTTLGAPVMMTNLYPFLMGQAALKHERIPDFPQVAEGAENHILAAHCGYLGVVPRAFSTEWALRKKVLRIVDDERHGDRCPPARRTDDPGEDRAGFWRVFGGGGKFGGIRPVPWVGLFERRRFACSRWTQADAGAGLAPYDPDHGACEE